MPIVTLPDGREVEFPEGTPQDVMLRALRQFTAPQQPAAPEAPAWQQGGPQEAGTSPLDARSTQPPPPRPFGAAQGIVDTGAGLVRDAAGALNSFRQGAGDIAQGGAQLLANALPTGAVDWVNRQAQALNEAPYIGPATVAAGMTPATAADINQQTGQRETGYQAERQMFGQEGFDVPRVAGQMAAAAPLAVALPAGNSVIGSAFAGAAQGAASSALQPVPDTSRVPYGEQKLQQISGGAQVGAVMGPAGYMIGRALAPDVRPGVRELAAEGVQMTPGQMIGGTAQRIEGGLTSVPGIGDQIRHAQRDSVESLNRAVGNRVLGQIGQALPDDVPAGRQMVDEVGNRISQAYATAHGAVRPFQADAQYGRDVVTAIGKLPNPQTQQQVAQQINGVIAEFTQGGPVTGEVYQKIKSELGRLARDYANSAVGSERQIGRVFEDATKAFRDLLVRTNPAIAPSLRAADQAHAMAIRMNAAAAAPGATDGVFTPTGLSQAVRQADPSLRHNAYARGDALLQDLSDRAKSILPSTVPDSGTPYRAALMAGLLGGGGALGVPPAALAAGAGAYAAYTPLGQRIIQMLLARQPGVATQAAGNAIAGGGGLAAPAVIGGLLAP